MAYDSSTYIVHNDAVATAAGQQIDVSQARWLGLTVIGRNDAGGGAAICTIKVRGTKASTPPTDWTAAQSVTQPWDHIGLYDEETGNFIPGDTGVVLAANDVKNFKINVDVFRFVSVVLTNYTSGRITVHQFNIREI